MTQHITCIRSDGVGEQVLNIMSTILYTRYNNLVYAHTPFDRIHHLARYPIGDVENFFNLGYGEVKATAFSDCRKVNGFHSFINSNPEYFLDFIPSFKAKYYLTTKTCRFDRSKINVAIHIRRGDVREGHKGRHGYQRHTQNSKIREILDRISHLPFPFIFHIYSEGSPKDFQEFGDCILHLNEDVLDTFHHLVTADILIMAKSAYSYVAALLSDGIKIYEYFWYPKLQHWLQDSFETKLLNDHIQQHQQKLNKCI